MELTLSQKDSKSHPGVTPSSEGPLSFSRLEFMAGLSLVAITEIRTTAACSFLPILTIRFKNSFLISTYHKDLL